MGNKLKDFRLQKRMTQEELARASGVSRKTICDLESDKEKNTTSKTLVSLATALGASVDEIFFADSV